MMDTLWNQILWQQFGASIDMLDSAIRACPEQLWSDRERQPEFWRTAYHTLFFLELSLSGPTAICEFPWVALPFGELHLYTLRHV